MCKYFKLVLFGCCFVVSFNAAGQQPVYTLTKGIVSFHSSAPNELIYASSDKLEGLVDQKNFFLFKLAINSFSGFNSPLQKEHFNENYMESDIYPIAVYKGKIIENVDFNRNGEYEVRAKGKLLIHGIEQERIIMVHIVSADGILTIKSNFKVLLSDYNIKIPRIVSDKLSPEIDVSVHCTMMIKR